MMYVSLNRDSEKQWRGFLLGLFALCYASVASAETQSQPPALPGQVANTALPVEVIEAFEARKQALVEREIAALAALAPAGPALLQRLEEARDEGVDPAILEWEEQSYDWYAGQISGVDPQPGSKFPAAGATLKVAMMSMQLAFTVTRPDTNQQFPINASDPVLQVAQAGSPVQAILWIPGFGYAAVPAEYVAPYVNRADMQSPLQIGSIQ